MAAPAIAVVAKKAIQIVLTDKKLRKGFFMILGIILVIIIMPIVAVLGIFMGGFTIDMDRPRELLEQNISQATDQWGDVQTTLINNGHDVMTLREAEVLYAYVLYRYVHLDNFVSLFTGCFATEQTDEQLISNVNAAFGTNIATQEFTDIMASIRSTYIDTSHYTDPLVKNSTDLVLWCQNASATGWGYVWGTYGTVLTETFYESKKAQYPNEVGGQEEFIKEHWLNRRTADCIGLIKGFSWYDTTTGQTFIGANGMPDIGANGMYNAASTKGTIDTMPDTPGLAVWFDGHIGVYIGNGKVVEAKGTRYGVITSELANGAWTHWLKIPYIQYPEDVTTQSGTISSTTNTTMGTTPGTAAQTTPTTFNG